MRLMDVVHSPLLNLFLFNFYILYVFVDFLFYINVYYLLLKGNRNCQYITGSTAKQMNINTGIKICNLFEYYSLHYLHTAIVHGYTH